MSDITITDIRVMPALELKDIINENFYRLVVQNNTPERFNEFILDIDLIRHAYEAKDEYELCALCRDETQSYIKRMDVYKAEKLLVEARIIANQSINSPKPFFDENF
jgi:hypothetical protein